jgi:hypothetical protein
MLAVMIVEVRKLHRSLAGLLALAAPALIPVFLFFNLLRAKGPQPWGLHLSMAIGIWAFFLLPMSVTALTALVAQMEHGPRSWDHLRALPVPRWRLYAAKTLAVVVLVAAMSAAVLVFSLLAIQAVVWIKPALAPTGEPELARHVLLLSKVFLASMLLIAVQLWTALRFASFVPALAVGIGGTFFSVVATSAEAGVFMPWQMPVNMLTTEAWRTHTALGLGCGLGVVALAAMMWRLSRREVL